ncbi:E1 ubiquitin-activating protein uba2 [Exophiala dermatitidis]|nr:E1 ubiquitin-activating protein uba2 [Exophiala dermatitidis]KAJ4512381.1 E1 ubiquitin-activating protein uba2 [Exophiala dermatitidis]KAJ4512744.1 E1 ubiquitin-activating protein uba2 [Exophiala dermatitidis]KAJ4542549.1 E1 ubiquitin-activating protein uba2 [Exophiala dermatitidis]KAJ4546527.1 E1 ubiquitin-activating protein uba2 [Exophiala dermatitidis]
MPREKYARQSLGSTYRLVKESRVLLVGAGGIGCELLKNLVLTGFGEVHIIDLDTIDLSNLNRQFLFRQEHIKKPKALVAKEVAQKFNPNVKLVAHHANIKDKQFNLDWFSSFNLVFNALDNMEARRHVNKMCLAVNVPLIESGTTGFKGQVQVITKGKTACYDCTPKTTPISYPVCTIRSTPSQPIHCIVWAKSYLLPELFGVGEEETAEVDQTGDGDDAQEIKKLKEEAQALKKIRESMGSTDSAKKVFDKVFKEDIERLAKMEDMWKDKKPPEPLSYDLLEEQSSSIDSSIIQDGQRVWSTAENFVVFKDSLRRLSERFAEEQSKAAKAGESPPIITFDKDDDDTMDFVAAAGNLRAIIFGIETKTRFDIKQMAGNIIPAIATTNAMVAGLCVMQAFKVLKGDFARTRWLWLWNGSLRTDQLETPNPECPVCSVAMARVHANLEKATLNDLVHEILRTKLGYGEELTVLNDAGVVYDPDLEDNLDKKLVDLGIDDASFILIKDEEDDNPRIDLRLAIEAKKLPDESKSVVLVEKEGETFDIPRKPAKEAAADEDGVDGVEVNGAVVTNGTMTAPSTGKRKRELDDDGDAGEAPTKKLQGPVAADVAQNSALNAIVIDEDDGTLLIADDD